MFIAGFVIGFLVGGVLGLIYGSKNSASTEADLAKAADAVKAEVKKV